MIARRILASTLAIAALTATGASAEDGPRMDFKPLQTAEEVAKGRPTISDGERAAATIAIQNLMSRHEFMHAAGRNLEELDNYWVSRDGAYAATATFGSPAWVMYGLETIRNAYGMKSAADAQKGLDNLVAADPSVENSAANYGAGAEWVMHTSTTPIIEISGDGKTAQGTWYSPGAGIMPVWEDGKVHMQAMMFWEKYGGDFVKEDGVWKIWHLQMAYDFVPGLPESMLAGVNAQLGDLALGRPLEAVGGEAGEREGFELPPGFRQPLYSYPAYSVKRPAVIWPNLPRPYYTFSETYNNCNCEQELPF